MSITLKQITNLNLGYIDGNNWSTKERISYTTVVKGVEYTINIQAGFITDGASLSYFKAFLAPFDKKLAIPAIVHDACYTVQNPKKRISDIIFFDCMMDCITLVYDDPKMKLWQKIKAYLIYLAPRLFGRRAWESPELLAQMKLIQVIAVNKST